ncbi:MAG: PilZ domain-containing protein [Thermodesulfobacteriota bacterium]
MSSNYTVLNRRRFPRFSPKKEMYVLHYNFGKVIDISMGGILFNYVDKEYLNEPPPARGILFGYNDHYMDEIPFTVVSDQTISKSTNSKPVIKQRRILFGDLTSGQVQQLERFILDNAYIPQLAYEAQVNDSTRLKPRNDIYQY